MVDLGKDGIEIKQLCDNGKVWAKKEKGVNDPNDLIKKDNIYIFKKPSSGGFIAPDGTKLDNLDDYEDINDIVEHQVEDLMTSVDSATGRMDYKIENK